MVDDIYERALVFGSSGISDSGKEGLLLLCSVAYSMIERKLKSAEVVGSEAFISSAALLALSMYAVTADNNFSSATIGSVSVTKNSDGDFAQALKALSDELISPYVREEDFAFLGVRY